jgi:hypothetical protein
VAEIKYKEGRHVGLDFYDLLIEEMSPLTGVTTIEMSPNLEASAGDQIGTDGNEMQGIVASQGVGASRKRRSTSPKFTNLSNSAGCQ